MNITTAETDLKDYLFDTDSQYRSLVTEHREYEDRLSQLAALPFPSEEEQNEEHEIKKRKLRLKDEMEAIISRHKTSNLSH